MNDSDALLTVERTEARKENCILVIGSALSTDMNIVDYFSCSGILLSQFLSLSFWLSQFDFLSFD